MFVDLLGGNRPAFGNAPRRAPSNIAFTAAVTGGARFGIENSHQGFSGTNAATQANGAPVLGSVYARAINAPIPNMPAAGTDFAYAFFVRTAAAGTSGVRSETLLGVAGQTGSGGSGGALSMKSCAILAGSNSSGQALDATNAGRISPRRQGTSWQWWPQTTVGADLAGIQLASDTEYLCVLGIKASAGLDYPFITFVDMATGTAQSATGATAITGTRPSAPLFNLLGALGAASTGADRAGWGGDFGEFVAMHGGTAPSVAQAQAVVTGGSLTGLAAACGATVAWRNLLDYAAQSGGTLASATGSDATVLSGAIGLRAVRGFRTAGVRLDRLGPWWVFPMAVGAASGKVWFEGSTAPGATVACFLRYLDGSTSAQVRATADGSGRFVASIDSAVARPFYRSAGNVADVTDCHHEMDAMDVGVVIPTCGQSELNILYSATWTSSSDLTPVAGANSGLSATQGPEGAGARWASVMDLAGRASNANAPRRAIGAKARPDRMIGRGVWADGVHEIAARIIADRGVSVMFVNLARSGTTVDQHVFDRVPFSQALALAGSGTGPYTATIQLADATVRSKFAAALGATDANALYVSGNFIHQVRPGTFSLDLGGGVVITDTKVSDSAGTLSGPGGITGTITYVAGTANGKASISLTFPSTPASTSGTMIWQPKSDTLDSSAANKTANINGYGVIEADDDVATLGLRFGWTLGLLWWTTANMSDAGGGASARASIAAKYEMMRLLLIGYQRAGLDSGVANAPMMVCAKGRDTNNTAALVDNARQFAEDMWASTRAWVRRGGHYYDVVLDAASSPHETFGDASGKRIGRRMGAYLSGLLAGTLVPEAKFRTGAADRSGDGTVLTVPLATIGSGLSLAVASGGNANALDQWYVGGTLIANDATTIARIRGDGQAVELVKLSGTWVTGAESNVLYVTGAPGSGTTPPGSLLYDNRGGFGGNEPGMLVAPKLG
ncbi:hypothetical protein [Novosphingobium sp. MD-1]|uniref:hypothetical protein n=1 Tax=Novosphingobium sp. MD-1 TaxID=1630648 RepID=UPI00061BAEE6|nr:hypothetical protein [Novosphingobium sp. MD-1]GAO55322.1 hypothetical protein NMD1_02433 [Novosphingobium sp. MD-1]